MGVNSLAQENSITLDDITQPVVEWALDYGIYPSVILDRLARGWPVERAITTPMVTVPRQRLNSEHMPGLPKLGHRSAAAKHRRPGVVADFPKRSRTGGGPTTQDFTEIEFSH